MALPGQGNSLSMSQIAQELGVTEYSLRNLSALAGFSQPDAISEFFGFTAGGGGTIDPPKGYTLIYPGMYFADPCWEQIGDLYQSNKDDTIWATFDGGKTLISGGGNWYLFVGDFDGFIYDEYIIDKKNTTKIFLGGGIRSECGPLKK